MTAAAAGPSAWWATRTTRATTPSRPYSHVGGNWSTGRPQDEEAEQHVLDVHDTAGGEPCLLGVAPHRVRPDGRSSASSSVPPGRSDARIAVSTSTGWLRSCS